MLGPLADNGGPTLTHALVAGSPAIDAGDNAVCPATYERGVARDEACDVGSFEHVPYHGMINLGLARMKPGK